MASPDEARAVRFRGHGGLQLRGDAWGDPAAQPVVLLHGGGQTRHSWSGTARSLAGAGFHALALDLRGHGESDWSPDGGYAMDDFVGDLLGVARELQRPPAVVGASLGGITALLAEGESEVRVASAVVLVDVTPRVEPEGITRIIDFMTAKPGGFASLAEAAEAVAAFNPHRERPKDLSGLEKNLRRGPDGRYRWHWDPRFMKRGRGPRGFHSAERLTQAARRLRVPTLLVRGRQSDVVSEAGSREFLEHVPHARFVDVAGAGHMVAGDRNDPFKLAVSEFLVEVFGNDSGAPTPNAS